MTFAEKLNNLYFRQNGKTVSVGDAHFSSILNFTSLIFH